MSQRPSHTYSKSFRRRPCRRDQEGSIPLLLVCPAEQPPFPPLQGTTGIDPELVINLLSSPGTIADTCSNLNNRDSVEDGRARGEHPWASHAKAQLAEKKLDDFMMKVHDRAAPQRSVCIL